LSLKKGDCTLATGTIEQNLENLNNASMDIIEKTGVRLHHQGMLDIARDKGVRVSDGKVYFTRDELMAWISCAPSEFTVYARNRAYNMTIGGDRVEHISYNSGFPYIADREGNRRMAHFSDYLNFLKLVHNTPAFNINGGVMITPDDLKNDETLYPVMLYAALLHSDKCLFGGMGGKAESEMTMEILKTVFETDKAGLIQQPRIVNLISSLSPLQFDEKMLDTMMVFVDHGQPVVISPAVMAGSTGPVTMAGAITISNVESLVGVALTQILRKGTPVIYGSATANNDMRTGAFTIGSPESALAVKYCARLAKMYGVPCRGGGSLNDAKTVSVQAGYEGMMLQMVANQEKINFNFHSAGGLDSYGSMSYEKFVVDLDILARIEYYLADLNTDADHLALDTILKVGPGGEFLTQMHTAMHCRKAPFMSDISLQGIVKEGVNANDALFEKMTTKVAKMLDAYEQPQFSPAIMEKLDALVETFGVDTAHLKSKMGFDS
jgi:trimethylamine--corrinoid protein Co-methyltransferase